MRSLWGAIWLSVPLDVEMHEEMRFHIQMETERLMRELRLPEQEARRRAHVAFGGVEKYRAVGRETRGLQWMDAMSLDTRLGVRMLLKHRALTFIGGFALAIAMALGATSFEIITEAMFASLPVDEGEQVVAVQYATDTLVIPNAGS
jgi:hypothetical protein